MRSAFSCRPCSHEKPLSCRTGEREEGEGEGEGEGGGGRTVNEPEGIGRLLVAHEANSLNTTSRTLFR